MQSFIVLVSGLDQKMAADHRAAAQALRDAEARSCNGIAAADRDISPFYHREDIEGVDVLQETVPAGRSTVTVQSGVMVYFRPVSGLTKELLRHSPQNLQRRRKTCVCPDAASRSHRRASCD